MDLGTDDQSSHKIAKPDPSRRAFVALLIIASLAVLTLVLAGALLMGRSGGSGKSAQSGSLQISGSESMRAVVTACAEDFMTKFTEADVIVKGGGSGEGISALLHGMVEIGMTSRGLTEKETAYAADNNIELTETALALDGIALIVHPSNGIGELDLAQLRMIYTGELRSWRNITGMGGNINVIGRASGSGTAAFFAERVLGGAEAIATQKLASNEAIVAEVASRPEAIGYTGLGAVRNAEDQVKILAIRAEPGSAAVAPKPDALQSRAYPLARTLYLLNAKPQSDIAKAFLAHCIGPDGQSLIQKAGYLAPKIAIQ